MKLTWYGHSSFLLQTSNEKKILMDPFDSKIGYVPYSGSVDIVTISHHHFDHSNLRNISDNFHVIDSPDEYIIDSIKITGIPSHHDDKNGLKRGSNTIFLLEADNYKLCHLGDIGHMINNDYKDLLENVDILMIPVGGFYTIDGKTASHICNLLCPKYVIPIHYKTPALSFTLKGPEDFLISMKNVIKMSTNVINLKELDMIVEKIPKVLLLSPPNM